MKRSLTDSGHSGGLSLLPLLGLLLASSLLVVVAASGVSIAAETGATPMHSVQLTQKGYIQFLRWELPVPDIHEFTFCLWVKSTNLKHPHSIFSYSRNERERLIRSWISSRGRSIHLEIGGLEVFRRPVRIREHRWYHVCQSWENQAGRYALWLDGRLEQEGRADEMIYQVIPGRGDIVLGQEYTDFDKGLEEGIEGSVLGFNLLLASAFDRLDDDYRAAAFSEEMPASRQEDAKATRVLAILMPLHLALEPDWSHRTPRRDATRDDVVASAALPRESTVNDTGGAQTPPTRRQETILDDPVVDGRSLDPAPLGLQLVKLSYVHCQLGRGSPPIGGPLMLVSWSRTPVRVFGGAIVKNVGDECGKF